MTERAPWWLALATAVFPAMGGQSDSQPAAAYMTCARACADCQLQCDSCSKHCLTLMEQGAKDHSRTAELCLGCGDACRLAAMLAARQSPLAGHACDCCAKCCDDCAAACEKWTSDEAMGRCARECRACAKACRDMMQHVTAAK